MTKELNFKLDLSAIMADETVQDNFKDLDPQLKSALIETYSPILDQINELHKEDPKLDMNDSRVANVAQEISEQLDKIILNRPQENKRLSTDLGSSARSMATHFSFILQGLLNGKDLSEIKKGYIYKDDNGEHKREGIDQRLNGQFEKDFPRTKVSLVDQNGKIIDTNFTQTVLSKTGDKPTSQEIIDTMKTYFSISDKQAEFIVSRFNQRSIEGLGVTFKADTSDDVNILNGPKETKLVVRNVDGKLTLEKLQFNYTAQCVDDRDQEINPTRKDFSKTSYEADLSSLLLENKGLKDVRESLNYQAIHKESGVTIPEALEHRMMQTQTIMSRLFSSVAHHSSPPSTPGSSPKGSRFTFWR